MDGKGIKSAKDFLWRFPVVSTSPEDTAALEGGPAGRRSLLDRFAAQMFSEHWQALRALQKSLKERNAALKSDEVPEDLFEALEESLAKVADTVVRCRKQALELLAAALPQTLAEMTRVEYEARIRYKSSVQVKNGEAYADAFREVLRSRREADKVLGHTSVGPHVDDVEVMVEGHRAKEFASRGQKKAVMLAWKAAEARLLARTKKAWPILVLDDAFSELDSERRQALAEYLGSYEGQSFLSGPELPQDMVGVKIFEVKLGDVRTLEQRG